MHQNQLANLSCLIPGEKAEETILVLYILSLKVSKDSRFCTVEKEVKKKRKNIFNTKINFEEFSIHYNKKMG